MIGILAFYNNIAGIIILPKLCSKCELHLIFLVSVTEQVLLYSCWL